MKKYRPDDTTVLAEMTIKLSKLKLAKKQNPGGLEDKISAIENEYRYTIDKNTQQVCYSESGRRSLYRCALI